MCHPCHRKPQGAVYPSATYTVKKSMVKRAVTCLITGTIATTISACNAPTSKIDHRPHYPIAAHYAVAAGPVLESDRQRQERLQNDLEHLKKIGFDEIAVSHLDERDTLAYFTIMRDEGMRIIYEPRSFARFVRLGIATPQKAIPGESDLPIQGYFVFAGQTSKIRHSLAEKLRREVQNQGNKCWVVTEATRGHAGMLQPAPSAKDRKRNSTTQAEAPVACINFASAIAHEAPAVPALSETAAENTSVEPEVRSRLLSAYHTELERGATGGLLVSGLHAIPGNPEPLLSPFHRTRVATSASIKRLLQRARTWSPHLQNATPYTMAPPADARHQTDLVWTILRESNQTTLLIHNKSLEDYQRLKVNLADCDELRNYARAVEIRDARDRLGRVFERKNLRWSLKAELSPGDAILLELF